MSGSSWSSQERSTPYHDRGECVACDEIWNFLADVDATNRRRRAEMQAESIRDFNVFSVARSWARRAWE